MDANQKTPGHSQQQSGQPLNDDQKKIFLEEYKEAATLHRLHITLMFGQTSVFLAASWGLLNVVAETNPAPDINILRLIPLIGLIVTAVFFVISERAFIYSFTARERAKEIELFLGFSLYTNTPKPKQQISGIYVVRFLYVVGLFIWVVLFAKACGVDLLLIGVGAIVIVLICLLKNRFRHVIGMTKS